MVTFPFEEVETSQGMVPIGQPRDGGMMIAVQVDGTSSVGTALTITREESKTPKMDRKYMLLRLKTVGAPKQRG